MRIGTDIELVLVGGISRATHHFEVAVAQCLARFLAALIEKVDPPVSRAVRFYPECPRAEGKDVFPRATIDKGRF